MWAYDRRSVSYSTCEAMTVTVLVSSRRMPPRATSAYALGRARPLAAWTARRAAVRVVLPWSMWPMVPTLTWTFFTTNHSSVAPSNRWCRWPLRPITFGDLFSTPSETRAPEATDAERHREDTRRE